jgi:glycosyltransferase involved in cell wall biosynthesis
MDNNVAPPQISVCIVVLNGNTHVTKAVESVLNQNYPALELIVIDGGSTDGTLETLRRYSKEISQLISEPDRGIYDAMNKACAIARGEWLIFLGCDDIMLDSLASFANSVKERDTVYYGNVILKSTGQLYGGRFSKYRILEENICHQAIFYPRQVYKTSDYNLKYPFLADYEYNVRLIGQGCRFRFLNLNVAIYNDSGASAQGDAAFARDRLRILRGNLGLIWLCVMLLRTAAVLPYRLLTKRSLRLK